MGIGSAISGAIGALGNIGSTAMSYKQQKKLLDQQQAFEREKAQNYHQWEVGDLKAAGLNPILSAGGSPSLGSPSAPSVNQADIATPLSAAAKRELEKQDIENRKILMQAQGKQALSSAKKAEADAKKAETEAESIAAQFDADKPKIEAQKKYNKSTIGRTLNYIGMGGRDLQPAAQIIGTGIGIYGGAKMLGTANAIKRSLETQRQELPRHQGNVFRTKEQRHEEWIRQPTHKRGQMRY